MPKGVYAHKRRSLHDRLWEKVDIRGENECWPWLAAKLPMGYGQILDEFPSRRHVLAHRAMYEDKIGPIPDGMDVLHSCDNPWCVNPKHLDAGPKSKNMEEMHKRGRSRWHRYEHGTLDGHKPQTEKGQWERRKRNERGEFK